VVRPKRLSAPACAWPHADMCDAQAGMMLVTKTEPRKNQGKKYSVNKMRKMAFDVYPICPQHDSSIRLDV